ncbi:MULTISPECIES: nucleotidyltransferase family protein [Aneurinibacillus]|uniref:NDP-sugar synthase n=1 Tax=Aneurinibacillus thermoaerophilus TaxID=143495 RepID=A0A1G7XCH3_ANETH|nr:MULTISPECIES: NDP-sugar synthase [Aneurinibacillus]AMA73286.1 mannose-1-phosphate guanylyltransferase [Aneurinibacillus sp. XH2]MED0674274.1 NDP-sugar synthase [Aneurinibacillus thermoaerophilus]MED0678292.1 NDP-sugar synthase [Aneurinibacillus thermoaerophilus]MED0736182.1 NDP-sugar synthase [Aneurinibacillus thermoaerophilus]MED0757028.1 NDP-sugar synthase [Aneurinibacillus thermoaerophilus]
MKALLLAGGLGTRLRPLTENLPKPMALIGNRPWLEHLILHLKSEGIADFVIAVKHYPEMIRDYLGDGTSLGVRIQYAVEETLLGTAGAIKNAQEFLDDRFLVVNADIVHQVAIQPLLDFHLEHGGAVTIGLTEVKDPSQYGVVEQDPFGQIVRFVEKPSKEEAPSNRINAGIYVMEKTVLEWIPKGEEVSIERETFPLLIEKGMRVYGKVIDGYWLDMGTKERYRKVHWDLLERKFRLPLGGKEEENGIWIGENTKIGSGVLFVPPVLIGNRVKIGDRSVIGPYAVIGDHCEIGQNVRCSETIMWNRCRVHNATQLKNCIFGYDLELGSKHILYEAVMNRWAGGLQG